MSGLIWALLGAFTLYVLQVFRGYLKKRNVSLTWYAWLSFIVWYALAIFTVDFVSLSLYEGEPQAAAIMGVVLGLVCLASLVGLRKMLKPAPVLSARRSKGGAGK